MTNPSVTALREIVEALDLAHRDNVEWAPAKKVFAAASKRDKETWAPLKALMGWKYLTPTSTQVLQTCVETGGALGAVADQFLSESPREVWCADGVPLPLPGVSRVAATFRGDGVARVAINDRKGKLVVVDLADFSEVFRSKVDGYHDLRFTDANTLRVLLGDGRLMEVGARDKKPRVLSELGPCDAGVLVANRAVVVRAEEENGELGCIVAIDDKPPTRLTGVANNGLIALAADAVYVGITNKGEDGGFARIVDGVASLTWLPRYDSGGSAPPIAEHAAELVELAGETYVITSRRWLRARDLTEDPRFGSDFDGVDVFRDEVWSSKGDRVKDGKRMTPVGFIGHCVAAIPIDETHVVLSLIDAKDKGSLQRYRRYTPR